mmetsp:Transcript_105765/g.337842  ORF Transcript_105765/g.337842 Transcript_105765/m.337842 type:complete len:222 (-) Transcript_105765:419-1084(-)
MSGLSKVLPVGFGFPTFALSMLKNFPALAMPSHFAKTLRRIKSTLVSCLCSLGFSLAPSFSTGASAFSGGAGAAGSLSAGFASVDSTTAGFNAPPCLRFVNFTTTLNFRRTSRSACSKSSAVNSRPASTTVLRSFHSPFFHNQSNFLSADGQSGLLPVTLLTRNATLPGVTLDQYSWQPVCAVVRTMCVSVPRPCKRLPILPCRARKRLSASIVLAHSSKM